MDERFDFNQICSDMEMDHEDILHLMRMYQDELDHDLIELAHHLKLVSWSATQKKLHKMKGDASNLCLYSLYNLLKEMEADVLQERYHALHEKLGNLQRLAMVFHMSFREYTEKRRR